MISEDLADEMAQLYEDDGWTFQDLADRYGISVTTIWRRAHRDGWEIRKVGPISGRGAYWRA